ncbi:peptide chain release factor N(5)-glutamine methyltransferase [Pyruvatibacter sp.]|uniref:peptide chain release factor N(5)-glutamine methyltransferase n=1 Tax=Pyruvatibacter sp. TaxID=1981328 RepID=UPI003263A09D
MTGETLSQALSRGRAFLTQHDIETAALDARLLLQAAAGLSHEALVMHGDETIAVEANQTFQVFLDARSSGKPVSRILGHREFWGLELGVSGDTLDPRPDTETLVAAVLDRVGTRHRPFIRDLGTGSGAILLALLTALPQARGLGSDLSYGALRMARANARATSVDDRAAFVLSDWGRVPTRLADVVVSNPPYIARGELPGLMRDVRGHDPVRALDGGADGLEPYRRIAGQLPLVALPGALLAFEIGPTQATDVQEILRGVGANVSGRGLGMLRDLAGRPRVVVARAPRR